MDYNKYFEEREMDSYERGHKDGFVEGFKRAENIHAQMEDIDKYEEVASFGQSLGYAFIFIGALSIVFMSVLWEKYSWLTMRILDFVGKNRIPITIVSGFVIMCGVLFATHSDRTLEELEIDRGLVKGDDY